MCVSLTISIKYRRSGHFQSTLLPRLRERSIRQSHAHLGRLGGMSQASVLILDGEIVRREGSAVDRAGKGLGHAKPWTYDLRRGPVALEDPAQPRPRADGTGLAPGHDGAQRRQVAPRRRGPGRPPRLLGLLGLLGLLLQQAGQQEVGGEADGDAEAAEGLEEQPRAGDQLGRLREDEVGAEERRLQERLVGRDVVHADPVQEHVAARGAEAAGLAAQRGHDPPVPQGHRLGVARAPGGEHEHRDVVVRRAGASGGGLAVVAGGAVVVGAGAGAVAVVRVAVCPGVAQVGLGVPQGLGRDDDKFGVALEVVLEALRGEDQRAV